MAKKKTNSCLIGCGVGCLVLLVLAIALLAGGAVWIRGLTSGFAEAVETREALEEEFGQPADFTPPPDGSIPAARIEAFLSIRAATGEARSGIRDIFEALPLSKAEAEELEDQPFLERMNSVFGITSSAFGLAGNIGDFFIARNAAFVDHEMGLGEYSYIYVLAYYNWLGKSPADGPGVDEDAGADFDDSYPRVRLQLISNLENQLAALAGAEVEAGESRQRLEAEIEALRDDRYRIPWEDGLPAAIEESLAPFRERLESTYDPVTNPFELARMEQRNNFSFQAH